jgi:hypothetical protein
MPLYKRWTEEEIYQIREDKKVSTIRELMKLYNLTKGQILYALYRYEPVAEAGKPVAKAGKPVAAPKLEKARPTFFSYEWWFGERK